MASHPSVDLPAAPNTSPERSAQASSPEQSSPKPYSPDTQRGVMSADPDSQRADDTPADTRRLGPSPTLELRTASPSQRAGSPSASQQSITGPQGSPRPSGRTAWHLQRRFSYDSGAQSRFTTRSAHASREGTPAGASGRRTPRFLRLQRLFAAPPDAPLMTPREANSIRLADLVERSRAGSTRADSPHGSVGVEEVILARRGSAVTDASEDCCAICFEGKSTAALCTCLPCGHEYHLECVHDFFRKCFVRECPMCRAEIHALRNPDGTETGSQELRQQFRQNFFGVRFRLDPYRSELGGEPFASESGRISFFTHSEQIRAVHLSCTRDNGGGYIHTFAVPMVVIELTDSEGNAQEGVEGDGIVVSIAHSSQLGSITPDTAMVQNGIAVFDRLIFQCKCDKDTHQTRELLALKFWVMAPNMLVHRKAVYAGLYLKHKPCMERHILMRIIAVVGLVVVGTAVAILITVNI